MGHLPRSAGGVVCVRPAHHRQADRPYHVVLHSGGLLLYQGYPQIRGQAVHLRDNLALRVYLRFRYPVHPVFDRQHLQPDERYVVAGLGGSPDRDKPQRDRPPVGEVPRDRRHLPDHLPVRLVMHRSYVSAVPVHTPR